MKTCVIDYGSGNLHSATKALERAAREGRIDTHVVLTADPDVVAKADRIVLPGVGAFADCKQGLDAIDGMNEALTESVKTRGRPFLGICVGMQLLATRGLEHGVWPGLGWIPGDVAAIEPKDPALKIPHMGWNTLVPSKAHPVLSNIPTGRDGRHAYFVHSYAFRPTDRADVIATTDYASTISAIVGRDTIVGTQFHPEKSQALGLAFLTNFLRWTP